MIGQMSIFDIMQSQDFPDFTEVEHEKTVQLIGNSLGVYFRPKGDDWMAKKGNLMLRIDFGTFVVNEYHPEWPYNGKPFIGLFCDNRKSHHGAGTPCTSIDEAVRWFRRTIERLKDEEAIDLKEVEHE